MMPGKTQLDIRFGRSKLRGSCMLWSCQLLDRREWTKATHYAIHDLVCAGLGIAAKDRFWNEHNFIFERGGLYYHARVPRRLGRISRRIAPG